MVAVPLVAVRGEGSPLKRVDACAQERSHMSPVRDREQWQTSRVGGKPQDSLSLCILSWLHLSHLLGCQLGVLKEGLQTSLSQGTVFDQLGLQFLSSHTQSCATHWTLFSFLFSFFSALCGMWDLIS